MHIMKKVHIPARRLVGAWILVPALFLVFGCETTQPDTEPGPSDEPSEPVGQVGEPAVEDESPEPEPVESPDTTEPDDQSPSETDPPETDPPDAEDSQPSMDPTEEDGDDGEIPEPPDTEPEVPEPPETDPPETDPTETDPPPQAQPDQEQPDGTNDQEIDTTDPPEDEGSNGNGEPDEPFEVTEETYERTFQEVEEVIGELNRIIQNRDFDRWQSYLTEEYRERMSRPENLATISESPILQRNNITLDSLQDYFRWVVVPSRANARLDDLEFLDDNTVHAIMNVGGRPAILYRLEKVDERWKIGID